MPMSQQAVAGVYDVVALLGKPVGGPSAASGRSQDQQMQAFERKHPNVRVMQTRRLVQWGMFTMVAIMLDAIHSVLSSALSFDFFINLSDADLSLRTDSEMRAFLARHKGRSFVVSVARKFFLHQNRYKHSTSHYYSSYLHFSFTILCQCIRDF